MRKLKIPPSHGVSDGPKIVAAQTNMFSSPSGAALAPCQTHAAVKIGPHPGVAGAQENSQAQSRGRMRHAHLGGILLHFTQIAHEAERRCILVRHVARRISQLERRFVFCVWFLFESTAAAAPPLARAQAPAGAMGARTRSLRGRRCGWCWRCWHGGW